MSYPIDTSIPAANNDPADDQPIMKDNYSNISNFLSVDHIAPGTANNGYHSQVHFSANQAAPGLTTVVGTSAAVQYANTYSTQSWPYWQNALGSFLMMGPSNASTNGYLTLANGLILQWGRVNGTHGSNNTFNSGDFGTVTFATSNIAFPNACFCVFTTMVYNFSTVGDPSQTSNVAIDSSSLSNTSFTWTYPQNSNVYTRFYWLAIGN